MTQIVVATVNVNGIRAAFRRDMAGWLASAAPDVLLLQEVRADAAIVTELLDGWHVVHEPAQEVGRAGVAVAARSELVDPRLGLGTGVGGDQGRWVEAGVDVGGTVVRFVSLYLHSASVDHPSLDAKYAYLEHVTARMTELGQVPAIVGGDLNIAHHEVDIKNWKGNIGKSGFLVEERAWLDRWTTEMSWTDVGRALGGPGPGPFTWWSWRGRAFDNDTGWRIDYQFTSPAFVGTAVAARVDRAPSYAERFSDHAPMVATYDI
ncbi:MAG: exodeoxyribonuclease III [Micrococcales bacterium]|nr:exodeoxyribonuclease III [Micrococcales bacterium]MCL2668903.1 exodeoxyribonuclease III [Micrococcales bacterium]